MRTRTTGIIAALLTTAVVVVLSSRVARAEGAPQGEAIQPIQQVQEAAKPQGSLNTAGKVRLSLNGGLGFGFDRIDVGITNTADTVSISGGGGFGFGAGLGLGLSRDFDLDFDLGGQASGLTPPVSNASGDFSRAFLLATLKYKVPTSESGQFKFGAGIGAYFGGRLDVDLVDAGGSHEVVKYDTAPGVHLTGEFERFISPNFSLSIGAKVYFVKYKADSYTINGSDVPAALLKSDVRDLNGSGMDLMIGISTYFD